MGWKEDQQILKALEQLQSDVTVIKKSQSKLETNQQVLLNKMNALEQSQKDCCQETNKKLDQIIKFLIPPQPGPPAGFKAFLT